MSKKDGEIVEIALGSADVYGITAKQVASTILGVARQKVVSSQVFKPVNDFLEKGIEVHIPKFKDYISIESDVGEAESLTGGSFSYDADTVRTAKFGIQLGFTKESIKSSTRDLLKDAMTLASLDYANELDLRANTVMLGLSVGTITSFTGGTLGTVNPGQSPIVEILTNEAGTISTIDYYDGKVLMASSVDNTITFSYASNRMVKDAISKGSLTVNDILDLKDSMSAYSVNVNVLFVSTQDMRNFVEDTSFTGLFGYTGEKEYNCEIGELLDLKVVSSGILPKGVATLVDSEVLGFDITTRELTGYLEDKPDIDSVVYHLWSNKEFVVSNTLSCGIVVGLNKDNSGDL